MCGICGFTKAEGTEADQAALKAMCAVMAHRGPDGEGRYLADGIALGHRRLSLIDLAGGGQPLVRATGGYQADAWSPAVAFDHVRGDEAAVLDGRPGTHGASPKQQLASSGSEGLSHCSQGEVVGQGGAACKRGQWSIVFNGEIYNYRELRAELEALGYAFSTNSDTEVLLVGYIAWSKGVLQRVRGMFAFAIYNAEARELFCARDFFGIKPFYYTVRGGHFIFASEIKSILEHPAYERELNEDALAQYLCFQFSALGETFFKGIYKLPPGHCLHVGGEGDVKVERYWKPGYNRDETRTHAVAVEAVDQTMRESVRYHNVADVEVGSFLSSGIDSSYLAACLARENPAIKTFTVGFSEYEGERDEISWARELAGKLGVENDSKHIGEDEFWDVLPLVQWHMDEPSADPSAVALYFVDQIAARRVKAVLSGEGADEFFAGYRIYQAPLASEHMGKVPKPLLRAGSKVLRAAHKRGANYLERASEGVKDWYYTNANGVAFTVEERDRVLARDVRERLARETHPGGAGQMIGLGARCMAGCGDDTAFPEGVRGDADERASKLSQDHSADGAFAGIPTPQQLTAPVYAEVDGLDEVTRMQYVDLWFWLVGDILLKTDKMSMAHSLESRVPFLDRVVFELAASIPARQNVSEEQTKMVLREAAERAIPSDWAQKEKLGFPVPVASWLREGRRCEEVRRAFKSDAASRFFNVDELMRLLDEHCVGSADNSRRIWIVYSFLLWYRVYFIERAKPAATKSRNSG